MVEKYLLESEAVRGILYRKITPNTVAEYCFRDEDRFPAGALAGSLAEVSEAIERADRSGGFSTDTDLFDYLVMKDLDYLPQYSGRSLFWISAEPIRNGMQYANKLTKLRTGGACNV